GSGWSSEVPSLVLGAIEPWCQTLSIPDPVFGMDPPAWRLIEGAAMVVAPAASCSELDICATLRARVCTKTATFYAYLFDCAQTDRHRHVEDSSAALETVRSVIDSVHSDVDCAPGQVVVSRTPRCRRGCSLPPPIAGQDAPPPPPGPPPHRPLP